jgi:hypothetical protein
MEALSQDIDTAIRGLFADVTTNSVTLGAYDATTNPHPAFDLTAARRLLTEAKVPLAQRRGVVPPETAAALLHDDLLVRADAAGSAGMTSALADGQLGRTFGFDLYETSAIADSQGCAFHPSAFQFVSRPLMPPKGAAMSEIVSYKGLNVRVTYGYNPSSLSDQITFDVLYGVKTVDETRAVILDGTAQA